MAAVRLSSYPLKRNTRLTVRRDMPELAPRATILGQRLVPCTANPAVIRYLDWVSTRYVF